MTRNTSYALLAVVLLLAVLGSVPGAHAAQLPALLQPLADFFGSDGLGMYKGNEMFFDSVIAILIFVSLSNRFLAERIGKAGAIGIGIALSIALVVGGRQVGFSFIQLSPYAVLLVFVLVLYLLYALFTQFGSNRVVAFAFGYALGWTFFKPYLAPLFESQPTVLSALTFFSGVMFAVSIIAIVQILRSAFGRGGGSSASNSVFGNSNQGGLFSDGNVFVNDMLDGAGKARTRWTSNRAQNGADLAAEISTALTASIAELEALKDKEKNLETLAQSIQTVDTFVEQAETAVAEYRNVAGPLKNRAELSMSAYREEMRKQLPELQKYFATQNSILTAVQADASTERNELLKNTESAIEAQTKNLREFSTTALLDTQKDITLIEKSATVLQTSIDELTNEMKRAEAAFQKASGESALSSVPLNLASAEATKLLQVVGNNPDLLPQSITQRLGNEKTIIETEVRDAIVIYSEVQQIFANRRSNAQTYTELLSKIIPQGVGNTQTAVKEYVQQLSGSAYSSARNGAQQVLGSIRTVPQTLTQYEQLVAQEQQALQRLQEFEKRRSPVSTSLSYNQRMQDFLLGVEQERIRVVESCLLVQTAIEAFRSIELLSQATPTNLPKEWQPRGWDVTGTKEGDITKKRELGINVLKEIRKKSVEAIASTTIKQLIRAKDVATMDGVNEDAINTQIVAVQKEIEANFDQMIARWELLPPEPKIVRLGPAP